MVRLCEARARCELREVVTASDAAEVITLMKASLYDFFVDDHGLLDFQRGGNKGRKGKAAEYRRFLGALQRRCASGGGGLLSRGEVLSVAD